jgi:lysophospholipase L1-like esterase
MKLLPLIIIISLIFVVSKSFKVNKTDIIPNPSPQPTPYQFPYRRPQISKNASYRIIIVGDSIVASLGPNANKLREKLISHYPDSEFVTYNYGYPATNIETLYDRLTKKTANQGGELPAVLEQGFELLIIESFAYNPLSHYPISEGLQKQNEILETSIRKILSVKPDVYIVFMTPIAFDTQNFARGTYDLLDETRLDWIKEREAYVKNHKLFAQSHGFPIIDIFELSKNPDGKVNIDLIGADFVHPSVRGVEFISQTIADFIYQNRIFPQ